MTRNKLVPLMFFVFLVSLAFIHLTSGLTWVTPTANQNISGTYAFNFSVSNAATLNCTIRTTANNPFRFITNISANQASFNWTNNTALLTEARTTTLTANCTNSSLSYEFASITIGIDNTAPSCAFTLDTAQVRRLSALGFTPTQGSTDTMAITYLWNLTNSENVQKATYTTSEPTFNNGDLEDLGEHTLNLTVMDSVGINSSCSNKFFVRGSTTGNDDEIIQGTTQTSVTKTKNNNLFFFIIMGTVIAIAFIGVMSWYFLSQTKRR